MSEIYDILKRVKSEYIDLSGVFCRIDSTEPDALEVIGYTDEITARLVTILNLTQQAKHMATFELKRRTLNDN